MGHQLIDDVPRLHWRYGRTALTSSVSLLSIQLCDLRTRDCEVALSAGKLECVLCTDVEYDAYSIYTDPVLATLPPPQRYVAPTSFANQVQSYSSFLRILLPSVIFSCRFGT